MDVVVRKALLRHYTEDPKNTEAVRRRRIVCARQRIKHHAAASIQRVWWSYRFRAHRRRMQALAKINYAVLRVQRWWRRLLRYGYDPGVRKRNRAAMAKAQARDRLARGNVAKGGMNANTPRATPRATPRGTGLAESSSFALGERPHYSYESKGDGSSEADVTSCSLDEIMSASFGNLSTPSLPPLMYVHEPDSKEPDTYSACARPSAAGPHWAKGERHYTCSKVKVQLIRNLFSVYSQKDNSKRLYMGATKPCAKLQAVVGARGRRVGSDSVRDSDDYAGSKRRLPPISTTTTNTKPAQQMEPSSRRAVLRAQRSGPRQYPYKPLRDFANASMSQPEQWNNSTVLRSTGRSKAGLAPAAANRGGRTRVAPRHSATLETDPVDPAVGEERASGASTPRVEEKPEEANQAHEVDATKDSLEPAGDEESAPDACGANTPRDEERQGQFNKDDEVDGREDVNPAANSTHHEPEGHEQNGGGGPKPDESLGTEQSCDANEGSEGKHGANEIDADAETNVDANADVDADTDAEANVNVDANADADETNPAARKLSNESPADDGTQPNDTSTSAPSASEDV